MAGMIDLKRTADDMAPEPMVPRSDDYSYGLCISLSDKEIDKLGIEGECSVGDLLEFKAIARVTACSESDSEHGGKSCRVELQITHMSVPEDEDDEDPAEEAKESPAEEAAEDD